ncbi:MAG: GNAT family N-acetyltransferase [Chloroflexi bacterium]|nr:GNAT family N-acetyltransferase [Chloroflexota bacterium]
MPIQLYPLDLDTDAPRYVELVNTILPDPVTIERVREWARNFPREGIRQQHVARDENGIIVGCNEASRRPNMAPGTFFIEVIVAPDYGRRGIGAQLYDDAIAFARAHGATRFICEVREHCPDWLRFAQTRGFQINRHIFESTLDLATFDEMRFAGVIESVQARGVRFITLADAGNTEANQRKLYELNQCNAVDIPGWEGEFPSFEDFSRYVFQASWFRAEGQILAVESDTWVGLGAVGYFEKTNSAYNMHTGVAREYRGRQIALALKLLVIRRAREWGAIYIRTNNDSQNAPILAINQRLGYKAEPGYFKCLKILEDARTNGVATLP